MKRDFFPQWLERNREILLAEYRDYAARPDIDYSEHGPMPFEHWAYQEWLYNN